MRRNNTILAAVLAVFLLSGGSWARPTTADEARMVAAGWLKAAGQPFGMNLGRRVMDVETYADETGRQAYYIVYLQPAGFVIVSADDLVEPIIGFAGDGTYDPSLANPLGALVANDLHVRVAAVRNTFSLLMAPGTEAPESPHSKWRHFIDLANGSEGTYGLMSLACVSDIRVLPLVQSKWGQMTACGEYTYNYYSPEHYPCGCLATAMAQVMRYYEYPAAQIGVNEFAIKVADTGEQKAYTRGGDGLGGPYNWGQMVLRPESNCGSLTEAGRQAIGGLCYDAAIAVEMSYKAGGSGAFIRDARDALVTTFQFNNAVLGYDSDQSIRAGLNDMINPNLDAEAPVILAIMDPCDPNSGHAVVCDGYGYESSALYHHLNMGWEGLDDIWYNLPDIDASRDKFTSVFGCVYNIFISGEGEIISGRVLDADGDPIANAQVFAEPGGRKPPMALTNDRGIYALTNLESNTTYTLQPVADGYVFSSRSVETLHSGDDDASSGNRWGVDFYAEQVLEPPEPRLIYVDADAPGDPGPDDPAVSDHAEDGSVERPFDAIQEAIDATAYGDVVIILSGTYSGDGNRDMDFKGKAITVRSEDPNDPGLVIIDCNGTADEPHRGFEFHSYETPRAILAGLTITGGYHEQGGGIYLTDCARPTITNCTFRHNSAFLGGGMYAESGPTLTNCMFDDNSAEAGGGLYNNGEASECSPVLTDCTFYGNASAVNGGAMYNLGRRAKPALTNCEFIDNSVSEGGGGAIRNNLGGSPALTNCLFAGNSAATFGGAIRNSNGGSTKLTNCTFAANFAPNGTAFASTPDDAESQAPCVLLVVNCIFRDGGDEIHNGDDSVNDVTYSNVQEGGGRFPFPGEGNIDAAPYFADPDSGDYHLQSQTGRWDPAGQSWLRDTATSPCIDAGDLMTPVALEPAPNGGVINMGAYGGTTKASKSNSDSQ